MPKKWNLNSKILSALRRVWMYSPMRKEALKRSKCGNKYICEKCQQENEKIYIHHKNPIEKYKSWDGKIRVLFCHPSELMCVCKECHNKMHKNSGIHKKEKV